MRLGGVVLSEARPGGRPGPQTSRVRVRPDKSPDKARRFLPWQLLAREAAPLPLMKSTRALGQTAQKGGGGKSHEGFNLGANYRAFRVRRLGLKAREGWERWTRSGQRRPQQQEAYSVPPGWCTAPCRSRARFPLGAGTQPQSSHPNGVQGPGEPRRAA